MKFKENFEKYKLKELSDISSSKRIFASEYKEKGIPFYRSKEIIEKQSNKRISNKLFISKERYIFATLFQKSTRYCRKNSCRNGSVGRAIHS